MPAPLQAPSKAGRLPGKDPSFGMSEMAGLSLRDQPQAQEGTPGGSAGRGARPCPHFQHGHGLLLPLLSVEHPGWVRASEPGQP